MVILAILVENFLELKLNTSPASPGSCSLSDRKRLWNTIIIIIATINHNQFLASFARRKPFDIYFHPDHLQPRPLSVYSFNA